MSQTLNQAIVINMRKITKLECNVANRLSAQPEEEGASGDGRMVTVIGR